jgi:hypothetical protein
LGALRNEYGGNGKSPFNHPHPDKLEILIQIYARIPAQSQALENATAIPDLIAFYYQTVARLRGRLKIMNWVK